MCCCLLFSGYHSYVAMAVFKLFWLSLNSEHPLLDMSVHRVLSRPRLFYVCVWPRIVHYFFFFSSFRLRFRHLGYCCFELFLSYWLKVCIFQAVQFILLNTSFEFSESSSGFFFSHLFLSYWVLRFEKIEIWLDILWFDICVPIYITCLKWSFIRSIYCPEF